jgi:acyl-CoA thioesterase I
MSGAVDRIDAYCTTQIGPAPLAMPTQTRENQVISDCGGGPGIAMNFAFMRSGIASALAILVAVAAEAAPITIVAIGASNTAGWGVDAGSAYPAQLQKMLRARGYDARVINAGISFETTAGMLRRVDSAVPEGTRIVILQPGGNDLRFFRTREQRAANIAAMVSRLRARNIETIVFDPVVPRRYYQWDGIHITAEGHAMFASSLLARVMTAIGRQAAH